MKWLQIMKEILLDVADTDLFQKILMIDSYLDYPICSESIFSLIGWLKNETNDLVRIELFYTISLLLNKTINH